MSKKFYFKSKLPNLDLVNPDLTEQSIRYQDICDAVGISYEEHRHYLPSGYSRLTKNLPCYTSEISIPDEVSPNIAKYTEKISDERLEMLKGIISTEYVGINNKDKMRFYLDDYDNFSGMFTKLAEFFGKDRACRMLSNIGIYAIEFPNTLFVFDNKLKCSINESYEFSNKEEFMQDVYGIFDEMTNRDNSLKRNLINDKVFLAVIQKDQEVFDLTLKALNKDSEALFSHQDLVEIIEDSVKTYKLETDISKAIIRKSSKNKVKAKIDMPMEVSDIQNMELVTSNLGGSNHATSLYERDDGQSFVVKKLENREACEAEYEAYQIYEAFGVRVPQSNLIKAENTSLLVLEFIGGPSLKYIDQNSGWTEKTDDMQELRGIASKDFAIDVLLSNYDAGTIHLNNAVISKVDGEVYKYDLGAALQFNHSGEEKGNDDDWLGFIKWDDDVIRDFSVFREGIDTRRCKSAFSSSSSITNQDILNRLIDANDRMGEVKKVASPDNYQMIRKRLDKALDHFTNLCVMEADFYAEALSLTDSATKPMVKDAANSRFRAIVFPPLNKIEKRIIDIEQPLDKFPEINSAFVKEDDGLAVMERPLVKKDDKLDR